MLGYNDYNVYPSMINLVPKKCSTNLFKEDGKGIICLVENIDLITCEQCQSISVNTIQIKQH